MLKTVDMLLANHQWELLLSLQVYLKLSSNHTTPKVDINTKRMKKQQIKIKVPYLQMCRHGTEKEKLEDL
jgi:hypothetical protein